MCPRFVESWLNEPGDRRHVVLGQRLRPFSEHHRFLLLAIDSPLLTPGAVPTPVDVENAVRICRSHYRVPLARVLPPQARSRIARWCRQVKAIWTGRRYPLPLALSAWTAYLRDYCATPEFWQKPAAGVEEVANNLPESLNLVSALVAGGTFGADNEAACWDMPLGKAHWYATAFAKRAGADLKLRTESDGFLEQMGDLKKRYAALKGKRTVKKKKA